MASARGYQCQRARRIQVNMSTPPDGAVIDVYMRDPAVAPRTPPPPNTAALRAAPRSCGAASGRSTVLHARLDLHSSPRLDIPAIGRCRANLRPPRAVLARSAIPVVRLVLTWTNASV